MVKKKKNAAAAVLLLGCAMAAQEAYQPKFRGDPAHSNDEAVALGYMRTVLMAEHIYKKQQGKYASSLAALVNKGSFTRRMTKTDRGAYAVSYRSSSNDSSFSLGLTPKQFDENHRAFYTDATGVIRAEPVKPATAASPPLK